MIYSKNYSSLNVWTAPEGQNAMPRISFLRARVCYKLGISEPYSTASLGFLK